MTTLLRNSTLCLFAAAALLFAGRTANADHGHGSDYRRLDRLAIQLEAESRTLYFELRTHAFHEPELQVAMNEVASIHKLSRHIHDLIHVGDLDHVHADVLSVQRMIHHVDEHLAGERHFERHVARMDGISHAMDEVVHDLEDDHFGSSEIEYAPRYIARPAIVSPSFGGSGFSVRFGR